MPTTTLKTYDQLAAENGSLRRRAEEAEATVEAIRMGEVDAVVVYEAPGERVYTLEGADQPYRLLIEVMRQGAATLHRNGTVLYCNRYFADLLGRPPERVAGHALAEFLADPDGPPAAGLLRRAAAADARGEVRLRRADGTGFPAELAFSRLPVKDALCLVVTDLTQQKQYEELEEARGRLAEADRKKDEFLALLAHELRNPLAPIRTGLQVMRLAGDRPAAAAPVREMMERQIAQMVRLVDDLLDVSRITRGKIDLRVERVELAAVVQNAVEASGPLIEAGGHRLTITAPPDAVPVEGDVARLTQVVSNLLNNAAKYTPPGGHIRLAVGREGGQAVVRVADTGVGIPAAMLPRVFDLFTQVDQERGRSQGGLGIGLSLVRRLVEMHGGTVEVSSPVAGGGSEFVVRLPLAAPAPDRVASPGTHGRAGRCPPRRILVVDDNVDAADSLAMLLGLGGHEVRLAHSGLGAIEGAAAFAPEVVLLDLGMPGMDGYETGRRVRELRGLESVVLVALTGWGQDEDRRRTDRAGFDAHLVKPVDPAALNDLLGSLRAGFTQEPPWNTSS